MNKPAIIKATFLIDTDVFQRVSQWESSLIDFYAAHGVEIERIQVIGGGDNDLYYSINPMDMVDKKVNEKPKATAPQDKIKKLQKAFKK